MIGGKVGSMRHRITLMDEVLTQGAGGRMIATSPIIADVWAGIDERSAATVQRAGHQFIGGSITFETWFHTDYTAAKIIQFGPARYKVQTFRKKGVVTPTIEFQTVGSSE